MGRIRSCKFGGKGMKKTAGVAARGRSEPMREALSRLC
jgi:hypothetical protein